jgi:hypothetical protein
MVAVFTSSVADPGCLSRIPDPDFYPSRIPDPGSKNSNKRKRRKKISCHTFLYSHKFQKIVNYFSFGVLKKKIWANSQRIIELFTKKIVKKLLKIWSWDPGSGKKTYSGSRIQGSKRHRIPNPGSGSATLFTSLSNAGRKKRVSCFEELDVLSEEQEGSPGA